VERPAKDMRRGQTLERMTKMLVLSRRSGESIVIGDDIVITVVSVQGGRVRLGIQAPRSVGVNRSELGPKKASEPQWVHDDVILEELQLV
jgi:carbon storage regulator